MAKFTIAFALMAIVALTQASPVLPAGGLPVVGGLGQGVAGAAGTALNTATGLGAGLGGAAGLSGNAGLGLNLGLETHAAAAANAGAGAGGLVG